MQQRYRHSSIMKRILEPFNAYFVTRDCMTLRTALLNLFAICFCSLNVSAQLEEARYTTYLDEFFRECKKKDASYVRQLFSINDSLLRADVRGLDGVKKMDGTFILRQTKLLEHGLFVFYFPGGKVESEGLYEYGYKTGAWRRFEANGTQKPDRYYKPETHDVLRALEK